MTWSSQKSGTGHFQGSTERQKRSYMEANAEAFVAGNIPNNNNSIESTSKPQLSCLVPGESEISSTGQIDWMGCCWLGLWAAESKRWSCLLKFAQLDTERICSHSLICKKGLGQSRAGKRGLDSSEPLK
jgi:hypothetical protein